MDLRARSHFVVPRSAVSRVSSNLAHVQSQSLPPVGVDRVRLETSYEREDGAPLESNWDHPYADHWVIAAVATTMNVAPAARSVDCRMTHSAMGPNRIQAWLQGPDHQWFWHFRELAEEQGAVLVGVLGTGYCSRCIHRFADPSDLLTMSQKRYQNLRRSCERQSGRPDIPDRQ